MFGVRYKDGCLTGSQSGLICPMLGTELDTSQRLREYDCVQCEVHSWMPQIASGSMTVPCEVQSWIPHSAQGV